MIENNNLPDGWGVKQFIECIEKEASSNKLKIPKHEFQDEGEYPIIDQGAEYIAGYTNDSSKVYNGDLPIVIFGDHTRIFKYVEFPFALGADGTKILVPKRELFYPKYFYFFLNRLIIESHGYSRHYKFLKEKQIVIPPLPVQKKIAGILEKAEKLKQWRAEADKLTDEFLQSTFLEMFGDPIKNNKNWKIKTIEDFSSQIIDCPHSTPKHVEYITDFPCIRTTELKDGYIDWKKMKYLDEEEYEKRVKRLVPVKGDIIYGREGSFGEAVRIPTNTKISLGQRVMLFRPKSDVCNSEFFWALLNSDSIYFQALKKTNGSTVGHVNIKDIKKFKCICPPLPLQQKFAAIVQQVEQMRQYQQESKAHIDDLFNALMQKAFKGELVA